MRKLVLLLTGFFLIGIAMVNAQTKRVTGNVTSADDKQPIPGATIQVKGTSLGTISDADGNYSIKVPDDAKFLTFSFVGMGTTEVLIDNQTVINVELKSSFIGMDEVVVTALGISREKKSLGYSVQEVDGERLNSVKNDNFVNSISGRVAGVEVKPSGNMGGSTNIIIRGNSSLLGNNQALFVVDGVPINNSNINNTGQMEGRNGYDYGNAVSDINPNDIESMSVLKGAAATALYGSRAANGVILITTKKGKKDKKIGVSFNSNFTLGVMDKSTFPEHQTQYGAGYGPYYSEGNYVGLEEWDYDGDGTDDLIVPTYEDASFGQIYDPNLLVFQYDSYDPASPNYGKKTPWVAGSNGADYFMQNAQTYTNSLDISGAGEKSTFRLSYTNMDQTGLMPNSSLKRNNFLFNGSYDVLSNLKVSASANYINTQGKGRNSTGYSDNIMSSFRQWYQTNVDMKLQEQLYNQTKRNITWNANYIDDPIPAYWDNPYWVRYENYETDVRERLISYAQADWNITDHLSVMGRASIDTYSSLVEERKAIGSVSGELGVGRYDVTSGYSRLTRNFSETNFDIMAKYQKSLSDDWNVSAIVGFNARRSKIDEVLASTNGGLAVPQVYALSNSIYPMLPPEETLEEIGVNGLYASGSVGYKNFMFLDATVRSDISSTLPSDNNRYNYPSLSLSYIFSEHVKASWLSMGKIRGNYAKVGNDAPFGALLDNYKLQVPFRGSGTASVANTKNNNNLRPEISSSMEAGLEMAFLNNRLGLDFAYYKNNTVDQILPVAVSYATGNSSKYVNAGEVENKGIELMLQGTPIKKNDFEWNVTLNWSKNQNTVLSLTEGLKNLQIADLQGGVSINARVGEAYGTIQGTDFIYHENGEKMVGANGLYLKSSTSDKVIGNINPDWIAGLTNSFKYKDWKLSFLVDWKQGGEVFSLDMWYGMATGLYPETAYTNDLGNPVRNTLDNGGGRILEGVKEDGTVNDIRIRGDRYYEWGYASMPNAQFIYDASYVKLRELTLTYSIPKRIIEKTALQGASISFVGSNLWIIHKNLPYADPEASQSSGNIQGWQSGVMPTAKNYGFSLNVQF